MVYRPLPSIPELHPVRAGGEVPVLRRVVVPVNEHAHNSVVAGAGSAYVTIPARGVANESTINTLEANPLDTSQCLGELT